MIGWIKRLMLERKAWKAFQKGEKEGERIMAEKSLTKSKAVWGAVIAGIGAIAASFGAAMQGGQAIDWGNLVPQILQVIGLVVGAIGFRGAIGKIGGTTP